MDLDFGKSILKLIILILQFWIQLKIIRISEDETELVEENIEIEDTDIGEKEDMNESDYESENEISSEEEDEEELESAELNVLSILFFWTIV